MIHWKNWHWCDTLPGEIMRFLADGCVTKRLTERIWMKKSLIVLILILTACGGPAPTPTPSPTSTATETPTPVPTSTFTQIPSPTLTLTPSITWTPTETPIPVDPLTGEGARPPIEITLPQGWQEGYDGIVFRDFDGMRVIPFAVYTGPVTGGQGVIFLLWGFPSVTPANPNNDRFLVRDLYLDGTRLLRRVVMEWECNIGTDLAKYFTVGTLQAVGANFTAVDCPATSDTRGWFAGLNVDDVNFLFFMSTDPIEAMDGPAPLEMQAILDTVVFNVEAFLSGELTPEVTAESTAEAAP